MKYGMVALILLMGLGGMAVSCQKEQLVKNQTAAAASGTTRVGDDDEDPVIKGKVRKSNHLAVEKAHVETFNYFTDKKVGETFTNSEGDYAQEIPSGVYYLKVTNPESGNQVYTSIIRVDSYNWMDVIVD